MNTRLLIAIAVLLFALAVPAANSQVITSPVLTIDVPFDFYAGGQLLPAGHYLIRHDGASLVTFHNSAAKADVTFLVRDESKAAPCRETKLVFSKEANREVLHQMALAGDDHLHNLLHPADPNDIK